MLEHSKGQLLPHSLGTKGDPRVSKAEAFQASTYVMVPEQGSPGEGGIPQESKSSGKFMVKRLYLT